ncbi:AAA family ATPase [Heyndrickxia vini]|uniref:Nuclease SbcCD subunit C n=1 Tax=Heyndrickxia vini TaxID=1476025 RepID=A0ABX7DZ64_9BACI|nr:SMC family ATPase [Heyndrickxia vini]QQZ07827.1 SMC family ATPase [Heyndrickxia vini]
MKPLKLIMQAFGPYAEKEVIDFTELGNRTMFVISGKTGSGKTTIFDGISFAIYGKASGEDRIGNELRSQFAKDELPTEVSLLFSLRNKTYFISRSPQQEKRKSRGDGYTTVGAKAELYLINEEGEKQILAANVRDTDEKIKEIIQLDANQFRQILMIPQGEFRKLLTSESKDKEQILQRLFHTEFFKRIEEQLKEEATTLKNYVQAKIEERTMALKSIYLIENDELQQGIDEDKINDLKVIPMLNDEIKRMQQMAIELQLKTEQKKIERDDSKKKVDEAETILKQFDIRDRLKKEKDVLESKKEYYDLMKVEIEQAYKASRLEQQDQLCHRIKKEYDTYKADFQRSKIQLEQTVALLEQAENRLSKEEKKSNMRNQIADELIRITNLKDEVYSFAHRQLELNTLKNEYKIIEVKIEQTKTQIEQIEVNISEKRNKQKLVEELKLLILKNEKELDQLTNTIHKLRKIASHMEKEAKIKRDLEEKTKLYEHAKVRLEDAKNTLTSIERKWQIGQASLLAQRLIEGDPCPVCGSTHHPNRSIIHDEMPTEKDLKSAKLEVEKLESEYRESETGRLTVKSSLTHLNELIEEQKEEIIAILPEASFENAVQLLRLYEEKQLEKNQLINEHKKKISQFSQIEKEITLLEERLKQERKNEETYLQNEKAIAKQYTELNTSIQNSLKNIPDDIRTIDVYEKKVKRITIQKDQLEKDFENAKLYVQQLKEQLSGNRASYEKLVDLVTKSEATLNTERNKFIDMLSAEGFDGYQQFAKAKREINTIKQLEQQIQNYREEYRSVSDRYQEIFELLKNVDKPQIEKLKQQFIELENDLLNLSSAHSNVQMKIHHNEEIAKKVEKINLAIKASEEKYKVIGHLSDISKGQNTYRITFERYVLAAFLDDILQVANIRLTRMTSGRYYLLRKTDRSKGNVQSGLELLVFDQYTGQERHVKTLSGGESFKASLALSLGLADIVQQHSGGVSLETMFIDEGFGTLDPESLDQAIESLLDIQNSGRLVGIISHVPELKERIDARLEVYSSQSGSKTEFHFVN